MNRAINGFDDNGNPVVRMATDTEEANIVTLIQKANAALGNNAAFLALPDPSAPGGTNTIYLAVALPTNAQVVAQVRALTQQMNALVSQDIALTRQMNTVIRSLLAQVTTITDT